MLEETKSINEDNQKNFYYDYPQSGIKLKCMINTNLFAKNITEEQLSRICYLSPLIMLKNSTNINN
jgi:hypothetical protein